MQVRFSTDDVAARDRAQPWRDFFAWHAGSVASMADREPGASRGGASGWVAGGFALLEVTSGPPRISRTAFDVASDKAEAFLVCRFRCGATCSSAQDAAPLELTLEPGDFCIGSAEWRFDLEADRPTAFELLVVPRGALSPLLAGGRLARPFRLPAGSPLASLIGAAMDAAIVQAPLLAEELSEAVLRNLCGLVALACGAASADAELHGQGSARSAQFAAARRYIDQHLADPDLSPARVAAALGVSARQLHRLFEPSGSTFAKYVLRQRLVRCRDTIAGATGTGRSVIDIAFGWGFNSMATFYRAFVGEFGGPPTELRGQSTGAT
jgi:AraC-like DNA-binding protein